MVRDRRDARPGRGERGRPRRRRGLGPRGDRAGPRASDRAAEAASEAASRMSCSPQLAEHGIRFLDLAEAERLGARGARQAVQGPGVPGADAARDRARPAVPLHLQPLAEPRRPAAEPREGRGGRRPRQGPEGAAAPLPRRRRGRHHLRPDRAGDRRQPRGALPGDGDRPPLALPGHPRHRLRRLATRRPTCCRPSRRRCAAAASARSCGSRSPPTWSRGSATC